MPSVALVKVHQRYCSSYPVKGTELCVRHTKSALAKQVRDPTFNPDIVHTKRNVNPAYNPFIHASGQPQRQDVISFRSTNPSDLNRAHS